MHNDASSPSLRTPVRLRPALLSVVESPEGSGGLGKALAGPGSPVFADLVFAFLGSLVESAAGNKFSSFALLRTNGVFAADREASPIVSPPFALIAGDLKLAGLVFVEVAEVVVLSS